VRSIAKVSTLVYIYFEVYDSSDVAVTGLVTGDFTKLLAKNGVDDATAVTVTEIGSGRYYASFTPATTGTWHVTIRNSTYNKRGWHETFDVTTNGPNMDDISARLPAALVGGRIDASVGAVANNAITAASINNDAITAAKIADGAIDAATFAAGAIDAAAIAADAIGSSELAASAANEIADALLDRAAAVDGYTPRETLRLVGAVLYGKGQGTPGKPYRAANDSADRVFSTTVAQERTAVTLSP
jgi:hypothetical protein